MVTVVLSGVPTAAGNALGVSLVRIPKLVIQLHDMMNQHHDLLYKHSPRTDYFKHKALTSFHGILLETKLLFWESQALGNES